MNEIDYLVCWKCGAELDVLPQPLERIAECPVCRADLHVCRLCTYYDTRASNACRETIADEVLDKTRANFCGYFQASANTWHAQDNESIRSARARLDALFGGDKGAAEDPADADSDLARLKGLFGGEKDAK